MLANRWESNDQGGKVARYSSPDVRNRREEEKHVPEGSDPSFLTIASLSPLFWTNTTFFLRS